MESKNSILVLLLLNVLIKARVVNSFTLSNSQSHSAEGTSIRFNNTDMSAGNDAVIT